MLPRSIAAIAIWVEPRLKSRSTRMPARFERLRVDLGDDERFGEVLRADATAPSRRAAAREQRRRRQQSRARGAREVHARRRDCRPATPSTTSAPSASSGDGGRAREEQRGVVGLQAAHDLVAEAAGADEGGQRRARDRLGRRGSQAGERDRQRQRHDDAREALRAASCPCRRRRRARRPATPRMPRSTLMTIGGIAKQRERDDRGRGADAEPRQAAASARRGSAACGRCPPAPDAAREAARLGGEDAQRKPAEQRQRERRARRGRDAGATCAAQIEPCKQVFCSPGRRNPVSTAKHAETR